METVLRFLRKLKFLFFRGQFNRELEEEMVFHREQVREGSRARCHLFRCRVQCRLSSIREPRRWLKVAMS